MTANLPRCRGFQKAFTHILLLGLAIVSAAFSASQNFADVAGTFEDEDGLTYQITQVGTHLQAKLFGLGHWLGPHEFKTGDQILAGDFDGHTLRGNVHVRYSTNGLPPRCARIFEAWKRIVLTAREAVVRVGEGEEDHRLVLEGDYQDVGGWVTADSTDVPNKTSDCGNPVWETRHMILTRHTLDTRSIETFRGIPASIDIRLYPPSAVAGQTIALDIHLVNKNGSNSVADRDYDIHLASSEGILNPSSIKIKSGLSRAGSRLRTLEPGDIKVSATNEQGLKQDTKIATACSTKPIIAVRLDTDRQRSEADGRSPIPFKVKFIDSDGAPSSGNQLKALTFSYEGVGYRESLDRIANDQYEADNIPSTQCVSLQQVISGDPGSASIATKFSSFQSGHAQFWFAVSIGWKLLLIVILGGFAGAFVRIVFARGRRPRWGGVALRLIAGMITGAVLFLVNYYVGSKYSPALSSSYGIAFAVAAAGGFGGSTVFRKMLKSNFPGTQQGTSANAG